MTAASVQAVCRVHAVLPDAGSTGETAIDKRAVAGPVELIPLGVLGDLQCDRVHHGGPDQAVYLYAEHDAQFWAAELGQDLPAGIFGENLRVTGVDLSGARIGTRLEIGPQAELVITKPRIPCATFARWLGQPQWVKRFAAAGRPGAYARVVTTGLVASGDPITVTPGPPEALTVAAALAAHYAR